MKFQLQSTRTNRALSGLAVDYFGTILNIGLSFVVTPWLVYLLKPELYGFWIVAAQVLFWLNLLDGGSGLYLVKAISRYQQSPQQVNRAIATVFWTYVLLAIPTLGIGWAVAPAVSRWAHLAAANSSAGILAFRISVIAATVTLVVGPTFQAVLFGYQKLAAMNTIVSCVAASALLCGFVFLKMGGGIVSLAVAQLMATWAGAAVTVIFARRLCPLNLSPRQFDRGEVREIFHFTAYFQMSKVAFVGNMFSDGFLIAGSLGSAAVSIYSLTQKLAMSASTFISKIVGAVMPGLAEIFVVRDTERIQAVTVRLVSIMARVSILAFILLVAVNQRFVNLWVGRQYFGGILITLLFSYVVLRNGLIGTFSAYLFSTGDLKAWGWLSLVEAATKISLTIFLLPRIGIVAPALGTAVGGLITTIYLPAKIASMSGLGVSDLFWQGLAPAVWRSIPTVALVVILYLLIPQTWGWSALPCIVMPALIMNTFCFDRELLERCWVRWRLRTVSD